MHFIYLFFLSFLIFGCSSKSQSDVLKENEELRNKSFKYDDDVLLDFQYNLAYIITESFLNYNDSIEYCKSLKNKNINTWRIPTFKELGNILNISSNQPIKSFEIINVNLDTGFYWTSKESKISSDFRMSISFDEGLVDSKKIDIKNNLICVSKIRFK